MSIPDLVGGPVPYWLPPGIHDCTQAELEARFVYNEQRQKAWRYFMFFLERVRDVGGRLPTVVVDGSFVTGRASPGDVDACCLLPPDELQAMLNGSPDAGILSFFLGKPHDAKRLFDVHVFASATEADHARCCDFLAKGEPPAGLRDADPLRDPAGLTKPTEKGLLRVSFAEFFAAAGGT